ncbi:MAG: CBS domain-containing protein [Isosphaeraceae bacterium]
MNEMVGFSNFQSLTAADVMTPSPRTCSIYSAVLEAVMIFRDADCGAVPILDEGKPAGILTDRDVALALGDIPDVVDQPVSAIMKTEIVTVRPEDSVLDVCKILRANTVRRVLVVDAADTLVGIIGWVDIAAVISERMMGRVVMDVILSSSDSD